MYFLASLIGACVASYLLWRLFIWAFKRAGKTPPPAVAHVCAALLATLLGSFDRGLPASAQLYITSQLVVAGLVALTARTRKTTGSEHSE